MVLPKKLPYEANHYYSTRGNSPEIIVTGTTAEDERIFELFSKSLPMSVDLDRLPLLRGINITPLMSPLITQVMVASGIYGIEITCYVWNGTTEIRNEDSNFETTDLLGTANLTVNLDDATPQAYAIINSMDFNKNFQGGIILKNKITVECDAFTAAVAVAGTAFPADAVVFDVFLEVDWFPASKNDVQQYINEMLYAERD